MTVPLWYIRERCPTFAYLPPQDQQNWMLFLCAEFHSSKALSAVDTRDSERARGSAATHASPVEGGGGALDEWSLTLEITLTSRSMKGNDEPQ